MCLNASDLIFILQNGILYHEKFVVKAYIYTKNTSLVKKVSRKPPNAKYLYMIFLIIEYFKMCLARNGHFTKYFKANSFARIKLFLERIEYFRIIFYFIYVMNKNKSPLSQTARAEPLRLYSWWWYFTRFNELWCNLPAGVRVPPKCIPYRFRASTYMPT
jgi:hypothetical protein